MKKQVKTWIALISKRRPALIRTAEGDVRQVIEMSFIEAKKTGEPLDRVVWRNVRRLAAELGLISWSGKEREFSSGSLGDLTAIIDAQFGTESAEETASHIEFQRKLDEFANTLSERERIILYERLLSDFPKTLEEIGKGFGVDEKIVRKIEKRLKEKLVPFLQDTAISRGGKGVLGGGGFVGPTSVNEGNRQVFTRYSRLPRAEFDDE